LSLGSWEKRLSDGILDQKWVFKLGCLWVLDELLVVAAPYLDLLAVKLHVAFLKLAHLLNFVQVDYKALLQVVELANALPAEDAGVLAAVKVLDALLVLLAHVR